jgi:transposase
MEQAVSHLQTFAETHPEIRAAVHAVLQRLKHLGDENAFLKQKVFGATQSEKIDPRQLMLMLAGLEAPEETEAVPEAEVPPAAPSKPRAKRKSRAMRLPANIEEVREVIIPEEVKADPEAWEHIGSEERTELEVTRPKYTKRVIERRKYVRKASRHLPPVIVPAKPVLIPNSYASVSLLVYVLISKYMDYLPLYRQQQIFLRQGIDISRKTMSDWMMAIGNWLLVIYEEMKAELLQTAYLQVDETPVRYLKPGSGHAPQGYLWTYHAPGVAVVYDWHAGRSSRCVRGMLKGYTGVVQCDGYSAYEAFAKQPEANGIEWLGCWAHARRKFEEAKDDSVYAKWMLRQIQLLYAVESRVETLPPVLREAARASESRMILDRIFRSLKTQMSKHLPKGPTGKAIAYTLSRREDLCRYLAHGECRIDNNGVENAIRPTAIGKKNHLFFGSECAGKQNAVIYSVIETCKKLGVQPADYLTDVLARLPELTNQQARELTPAKWLAARRREAA